MVVRTEKFSFRKPEFWQRKHPALRGYYDAGILPRIKHPRRLRPDGKAYRYICDVESVPSLVKAGRLARFETVECDVPWSKLRMTFATTNLKPSVKVEAK